MYFLPRAITRLLLIQLFFNCTQIHVITYTNSSTVSLVNDRNRLNPQDRSRQVLVSSVAPLTSLLMPFTGLTDPVVHLGGLTGSAKSLL